MPTQFKIHFDHGQSATWANQIKPFLLKDINNFRPELNNYIGRTVVNPMFNQQTKLYDDSNQTTTEISKQDLVDALIEENADLDLYAPDRQQLTTVIETAAKYKDGKNQYNYQKQMMNDLIQSNQLQLPDKMVHYTFTLDIAPSAQNLFNDFKNPTNRDKFKASWAGYFYHHPLQEKMSVVVFKNFRAQKAFQDDLLKYIRANPTGDKKVDHKVDQAGQTQVSNDFSTTWLLGDGQFNTDDASVNKVLMMQLNQFVAHHADESMLIPMSFRQLLMPTTYCLVNLETLAQLDRATFTNQLNVIQNGINYLHKFNFANMKNLANAQSLNKSMKKEHTPTHINNKRSKDHNTKSQRTSLGHGNLSIQNQIQMVQKLLTKFTSKNPSSNVYRKTNPTFMRSNRRHPDDINLPGHISRIAYRPDIAIYLDTSGSISEAEYKKAVTLLIQLTQALDSNLYFTSFSHYVAQPVQLTTKHQSAGEIYRQIQTIPKAGGGTEYENVWTLIDEMSKFTKVNHQADQLNFIISDFEYSLSSTFIPHVKSASMQKTYYLPMQENKADQPYLVRCANDFAQQMAQAGFTGIYSHMLM